MMKTKRACAGALLLWLLGGCIPLSLMPIYTDDVLVYEPGLEGLWQADGEEAVWTFAKDTGSEKGYTLTAGEGEEVHTYEARLVKLRDTYFLDLLVTGGPGYPEDPFEFQLVPVHTFLKISWSEESLQFSTMDYEWLEDRVEKGRLGVPHRCPAEMDGWPVFTATPQRMQRFLRRWMHEEEAWSDAETMQRVPPQAETILEAAPPAP